MNTPWSKLINETPGGRCDNPEPLPPAGHCAAAEIRLHEAVLLDGVRCYLAAPRHDRANPHILQRQAEFWIMSADTESPFSFVNVCDQLGLDYAVLREQLLVRNRGPNPAGVRTAGVSSSRSVSRVPGAGA